MIIDQFYIWIKLGVNEFVLNVRIFKRNNLNFIKHQLKQNYLKVIINV